MSHTITSDMDVKNRSACETAAQKIGAKVLGEGTFDYFSGSARGLGIQLPGWKYPAVVDLASGKVSYDNYSETWGKIDTLDNFMCEYAAECARQGTANHGFTLQEETYLENGDIELTVTNFETE